MNDMKWMLPFAVVIIYMLAFLIGAFLAHMHLFG
jgi:hypothetical protein